MVPALDPARIRSVFVRAPNWLGDVVMATPSFARIRSYFIEARIVCGAKAGHLPILAGSRSFDDTLPLRRARGWRGFRAEVRALREQRFDLAILFPNSPSTALQCLLAWIPYRMGYTQGRRLLITHGIKARPARRRDGKRYGPRRVPVPMPLYYAALFDAFGFPACDTRPILRVTPDEERRAGELFARLGIGPDERVVLLNPGAAFGPSKLWPGERWARLAEALHAELGPGHRLLLLVGPGEEGLAREILGLSRAPILAPLEPLIPLDVLKPVVRRGALMVTTDSGPRHLAVAFRVPHVVLMGPTHPDYTSAHTEEGTVLRHEVDCGPCHLPRCPLDHRCMGLITVEEVLAAARARLAGGDGR
ncbi:MAG: glycosyltransferase family 9 protein [Planctomycetota bacterium]